MACFKRTIIIGISGRFGVGTGGVVIKSVTAIAAPRGPLTTDWIVVTLAAYSIHLNLLGLLYQGSGTAAVEKGEPACRR